tara:strand:+ start:563 stop:799 length:237 start_codon:yes stop_codon:yes gene_type:complete
MTEQDLEYIKNTIDYMLNNSRHKNHEHVYNNASNSINKLEKAIEVIRCSTELKCGECDCEIKYPNIGCDTIKDCKKTH